MVSKYVYRVYGMNKKYLSFKSQRVHQLITTPDVNLRMLVPSQSGILQHMRRACIQAGYLWKYCECELSIPSPKNWGWKLNSDSKYVPCWQEKPVFDIQSVLKTCSCTKGICSSCSCKKSGFNCLTYCKCDKEKCQSCN